MTGYCLSIAYKNENEIYSNRTYGPYSTIEMCCAVRNDIFNNCKIKGEYFTFIIGKETGKIYNSKKIEIR